MPSARILVVDDDRFFREVLSLQLRNLGHEVHCAEDGQRALAELEPGRFDVVVSDLLMPKLDGLALTGEIRKRLPDQEVILVTQQSQVATAVAALRAGASDFLVKPVEESELAERLNRSLERVALKRERARLLAENLELSRDQVLFQRSLGMLSTLDLERLQETSLSELCAVCDAQSGALWLSDEQGELHLRSYRGLVERSRLEPRISIADGLFAEPLKSGAAFPAPGGRLNKGFYLPLRAAGEVVGLVLLSDRLSGDFTARELALARALGDFAATALRNARRYSALERLGLRDRETAAYNLAYFADYAAKEAYKARRYGRVFSLLALRLDGLERLRDQLGPARAAQLARGVASSLAAVVRDSDVVARAAEDELYVLLPETDHLGAQIVGRRVQAMVDAEGLLESAGAPAVGLSLGSATFPRDGQDFDELLHVCRRRSEEARLSLARKLDLRRLDFWSAVDLLLGDTNSPPLPADDSAGPSRRGLLPGALFHQLQFELALEVARDPKARGLLYVGCQEIRSDLPVIEALSGVPADTGMHIYLLGRRGEAIPAGLATPVYLDGDERIARTEFVLLYSERAAYALFQRRQKDGPPWGFHTSDEAVVDELVSKLQQRYELQPL